MKVTEKRIVHQEWYETQCAKTGWESHGWVFADTRSPVSSDWNVTGYLEFDKFYNPIIGYAEREVDACTHYNT